MNAAKNLLRQIFLVLGRLSPVIFLISPVDSLATPPTPPAYLELMEGMRDESVALKRDSLHLRIRSEKELAGGFQVTASIQRLEPDKPDFEQVKPQVFFEEKSEYLKNNLVQIPLQSIKRPGLYRLIVRLVGQEKRGSAYANDLLRYVEVTSDGTMIMLTASEIQRQRDKARESIYKKQMEKDSNNRSIRSLFDETAKIPEQVIKEIKPFDTPQDKQLLVRPGPLPDFLRGKTIDHSTTSWTSQDPITVRGRVVFQDIDGIWRPLINAQIDLWDDDTFGDEYLGSVATGWDGRWTFSVNNDDGFAADGRDIYYTFTLDNSRWNTGSCGFFAGPYRWQSAVHDDLNDGTVLDFSDETASTNMAALQVWSTVNLAWNHAVTVGGWDPGKVEVCYPASGTFFDGKLNVAGSDNVGPDSITHEYGHALMSRAYPDGDPSPGGDHGFGGCTQNKALSWSEGWATGFMLSARPDGEYNWVEGTGGRAIEAFAASSCQSGDSSEGRVAAALLDALDDATTAMAAIRTWAAMISAIIIVVVL